MKLKGLLFLPAAGILAAVAMGAAAALNVDGGVVENGADLDLTCVAEVSASATTNTALDPTIDFISIGGISPACDGQKVRIGLTGGGGPAEWYNGPISAGFDCDGAGGPGTALCFGPVPAGSTWTATNLQDIHITIYSY